MAAFFIFWNKAVTNLPNQDFRYIKHLKPIAIGEKRIPLKSDSLSLTEKQNST